MNMYVNTYMNIIEPLKKRKKLFSFASIRMDLEGIILNEISQTEKD